MTYDLTTLCVYFKASPNGPGSIFLPLSLYRPGLRNSVRLGLISGSNPRGSLFFFLLKKNSPTFFQVKFLFHICSIIPAFLLRRTSFSLSKFFRFKVFQQFSLGRVINCIDISHIFFKIAEINCKFITFF